MRFSSGFSRSARAHAAAAPARDQGRAEEARRLLLERIAEFITRHDLAVTAPNMATI